MFIGSLLTAAATIDAAPVIAVIILHEHIMWNTYIGIGLFLLASYMNIRGKKKEARINEKNNA